MQNNVEFIVKMIDNFIFI